MALIRALLMDLSLVVCGVDLRWFYPLLGVIGALCFVMYWPCKRVCGQSSGVHT